MIHQIPLHSFVHFQLGKLLTLYPHRKQSEAISSKNVQFQTSVKSEIGHLATGEVLRGTLEVKASEGCGREARIV